MSRRAATPDHDHGLDLSELDADPIVQFERWFAAARDAGVADPETASLATASADGAPAVRAVLLRGVDANGFTFYTNYGSCKARQLDENPRAALMLYWREQARQVRIEGSVTRAPEAAADAYFASRPRDSQLGAWASRQSEGLANRDELVARYEDMAERFADGPVPRPSFWGGYTIRPSTLEFWQGRLSRLHDRFRYARAGEGWTLGRLAP